MCDRSLVFETCSRCATKWTAALRTPLASCPRCGRALRPLRLRDNRVAAVLASVAGAALAIGFTQPFMTMDNLGERRTFSLLGGVGELFERGNVVIGTVLLVFSIIFPIAKIVALMLATSRLAPISMKVRGRLHRAAELTGKYSMLDVLVVAVIIVLVRFDGMAHVAARAGTIWFCAAVLLSMLSGLFTRLDPAVAEKH